jgi:2-polyprenyl-3-methyl-5-hydroxy-6-metoxy-1,4-benzoquinol methylase
MGRCRKGVPHTARVLEPNEIRRRVAELAPWFQNIDLGDGISTKDLHGTRDIHPAHDNPGPLWREIARALPADLRGQRVLDIGCNAGYMSFAAKRLGADEVLGIDSNLGATTSFIEQAAFCRSVLDLDVEFRAQSFFDFVPDGPFDLVLFCGVLYHLEDYATALDKVRSFATPGTGLVVLETAIAPVTLTLPGDGAYHGDTTTYFVPSISMLLELLRERDFQVELEQHDDTRALVFLRRPA